jgi:hypothetical protein
VLGPLIVSTGGALGVALGSGVGVENLPTSVLTASGGATHALGSAAGAGSD